MDYHIDAKNKVLGRLASEISLILQGKKSATFETNRVSDDKVYVSNYDSIIVTGKKATDKVYYKHTGYVGHLKEKSFEQHMEKDPRFVLRHAVRKMLPRNFLTQKRIKNLIFVEPEGLPKNAGKRVRPVKAVKAK
ncbi:MAG TPA: 50S ribosomal protein L13 [Candidatus Paceibacterota bacterium]|nr:50S ribosomal protein L13 [Candidatus Paceibacterota bacterium]